MNDFVAHIITLEQGKSFPHVSQIIYESGRKVDTRDSPYFIPTVFAAWWWTTGKHENTAYSAEFIRDGESAAHLIFGADDAASRAGIEGDWGPVAGDGGVFDSGLWGVLVHGVSYYIIRIILIFLVCRTR